MESTRSSREPHEWPQSLWGAISNNPTMRDIDIRNTNKPSPITPRNSFWPSGVNEWHALHLAINQNNTITELWFTSNTVYNGSEDPNKENEKLFFDGLANNKYIRKLHLNGCQIDNQLMAQMQPYLIENKSASELHINKCILGECKELSRILGHNNCSLHSLSLNGIDTTDTEISTIISSLAISPNKRLRKLDLSQNINLGSKTIDSCVKLLSDPLSNLNLIAISDAILDDERAHALATAISQNKKSKLEYLNLTPGGLPCRMTRTGWMEFTIALCDPSSVNSTYTSNHKLISIGYSMHQLIDANAPLELWAYLDWNQMGVGMKMKMISSHIIAEFNEDYFMGLPLEIMPRFLDVLANLPPGGTICTGAMYIYLREFTKPGVHKLCQCISPDKGVPERRHLGETADTPSDRFLATETANACN